MGKIFENGFVVYSRLESFFFLSTITEDCLQTKATSLSSALLQAVVWGREGCPECSGAFLALPAEGLGTQMEVAGRGFRVCRMVGGVGGWHVKSSIADAAGG